MSDNGGITPPPLPREPILTEDEVARRMNQLAELQAALAALGVHCVLARKRRLVLQYDAGPCEPSGLTNPQLHVFSPDGTTIASTDGSTYTFALGTKCSVSDPATAAAIILSGHPAMSSA